MKLVPQLPTKCGDQNIMVTKTISDSTFLIHNWVLGTLSTTAFAISMNVKEPKEIFEYCYGNCFDQIFLKKYHRTCGVGSSLFLFYRDNFYRDNFNSVCLAGLGEGLTIQYQKGLGTTHQVVGSAGHMC